MKSFIAAALLVAGAAATNHVAAQQVVHVVQVSDSNAGLFFYPENTVANVGDVVQFQFNPKNHSVVQSTFDKPCVPIGESMPEKLDGFFSGFMPTAMLQANQKPVYSVEVKSMDPMWFYCSQAKHCQDGMVGAINAKVDGEKTVVTFKGNAALAPENKTPMGHSAPMGGAPYYPAGTGAPAPYYPSSGAPLPTGAPTTFIPSPPAPTATAPPQATGAASSIKVGLTGFVGLIAAVLAL